MSQIERHKRLRLLIKKLNKERKRQASQVDILCNDMIGAQREFMRRLNHISFAARFYKSLLGTTDLRNLLAQAGRLIREELPGARIVFFLRQAEGHEGHIWGAEPTEGIDDVKLEEYLTPGLAGAICKSNRLCTMDDLFGMGLDGNRQVLNRLSAATLPLNDLGRSLGFVLLCRAAEHPLQNDELERLTLVACGLSQAVLGCGLPRHSRE